MRRFLIAAAVGASTVAGMLTAGAGGSGGGFAGTGWSLGCPSLPSFPSGAPGLASGRGPWAVAGGALVSEGAQHRVAWEQLASTTRGASLSALLDEGTIRHVAARPGVGTAFVIDRPGSDVVVAVTSHGVDLLPAAAEASNPAWSRHGALAWSTGTEIAVRDPFTGKVDRLAGPIRGAEVFAPAFLSERRIAAVVSLPSEAFEGERVGNLWIGNLRGGRWHQVTKFRAVRDRWVTIRTPVARRGGVDFVRVSASGSSTEAPTFEWWRFEHGSAFLVQRSDRERYLAGSSHGRLLWNRPDPRHGRYLLEVRERGGMRTIGCGAVLADPIDVVDPDRRGGGSLVPERAEAPMTGETGAGAEEVAIIVGDFQERADAETAVAAIRSAYPSGTVEVVDHVGAPSAIRPGVFGALLHLSQTVDPTRALSAFRVALPVYGSNSWIVTP